MSSPSEPTVPAADDADEPGVEHDQPLAVTTPGAPRLAFLDQLRAVAALYVALYHAMLVVWPNGPGQPRPPWYLRWTDFGHVSVSVFIVLSGFSLAIGLARRARTSAGPYWTFMNKRARRLLAPYWVALAGSIVLLAIASHGGTFSDTGGTPGGVGEFSKGPVPAKSIVTFFLLLHDVIRVPSPNSPLWSIAVEWHLYFLFPLLIFIGCRYGMAKMVGGALVVGVALHYVLLDTSAIGTTPHFLALFSFGIASAFAVARTPAPPRPGSQSTFRGIGLIAVGCVAFACLAKWEMGGDLVAGALVATGLWVLGSHPPKESTSRRSVGHVLTSVGLISYSFYLVHSPAEKVVWKFVGSKAGFGSDPQVMSISDKLGALAVLAPLGIAAALVGAYVLYLLVERPALRWSKQVRTPNESSAASAGAAPDPAA